MAKLPMIQMPTSVVGKKFTKPPWLLVIHQDPKVIGVAEYLISADAIKRNVSAHFAWSRHANDFVQMVPLTKVAYHTGDSIYKNNRSCNNFSIGIELPGPMDKVIETSVLECLDRLVVSILQLCPSITDCCGHKHIAPSRRTDPSDFFKFKEFCARFGLKHIF